jgi:hypothetical protein
MATGAKTNGPAAGAVGLGSSSWSCWSWFQQLELLVLVPAAACNLWHQLELLVSAPEANAPNSGSCWSQQLRPMVPAAGPVGLRH